MSGGGVVIRPRRGLRSAIGRHPDAIVLGALVVFATALVAIPAACGNLVLPGDNLFQNEPLRVLTGTILRSGRIPAWDPLIWSGTPLLAGWNAGSMFPGTWLFTIIPAGLAWTINLALAYAVCSTGVHLLLRRIGLGPVASCVGAMVFTYTGFMSGQIVHIGLVQGTAFTPWMLLALELMVPASSRAQYAGAVALFAAATACCVLAGDPRAPTSAAIIAGISILARLIHGVARPKVFVALVVAGGALGGALSAIQWLPGIGFLQTSQRATAVYSFFTAGSLGAKTLASNLLVPFLIGGNGNFSLPVYTGGYNLPEVTIGAGIVALVAVGAFLPNLVGNVRQWLTDRTTRGGYRLGTAYSLIVVGVLLTMGGTTPLGKVLVHVPLYSGERLQNRNAAIFDIGLAMLVAFFVEEYLTHRAPATTAGGVAPPARGGTLAVLRSWPSITLGAIGPVATAGVIVFAYAAPVRLGIQLGVAGIRPALFSGLAPYLTPSLIIAAALALFVIAGRYLPMRAQRALVLAFVVVDIATYLTAMGLTTVPTSSVGATSPTSTALAKLAGANGRVAIYNASFEPFGTDELAEEQIGVTDLNLLRGLPSVQGYGSIVNSGYETATSTHLFEDIDTDALNSTIFDKLNLTTLLTLPGYLDIHIPSRAGIPVALDHGSFSSGPGVVAVPPGASGPYPISTDQPATFLLSNPYRIDHISFDFDTANGAPAGLSVTAVGPGGGSVTRTGAVSKGHATIAFPTSTDAVRFDVKAIGGLPGEIGAVVVVTAHPGQRLLLDGKLQDELSAPHWTYAGTIGPLTAFTNHDARGAAWLEPPAGKTSTGGGSVKVVSTSEVAPTVMTVNAPVGGVLVRSEEYARGWTARLHPSGGGATIVLPVSQDDLIQRVDIPPGAYIVTWRYAPNSLLLGIIITAVGAAIFFVILTVSTRRVWGRRSPTA